MSVSFEQAVDAMARLPRMFIEPDGAFVWSGIAEGASWQIDGVLYDRQDRLMVVDLRGRCPAVEFDRLLSAFGWPISPLMFQVLPQAVFLDDREFRSLALSIARHTAESPRG
jgi:hypothetical protein